jgi:catechol 2,3-dioxygenase
MANPAVNAVRSVDFGVTELNSRTKFYSEVWGLAPVAERPGSVYLRGTGAFDHIVALHERPKAELLRIEMTAPDKAAVDGLYTQLKAAGIAEIEAPAAIKEPGGGYGFAFKDPEGRHVRILTEDSRHGDAADDRDRPRKIAHVVLNSTKPAEMVDFYGNTLGFKLSDRTAAMSFIRCNHDHHSIAFVGAKAPSLHHIAFEMPQIDSVMRGVGRHGPGNNVFAYFISPDEMCIEYTADVEQVDDRYVAHGPEYWTWPPGRNDQWGIATGPSERMKHLGDRIAFPQELFRPA